MECHLCLLSMVMAILQYCNMPSSSANDLQCGDGVVDGGGAILLQYKI